MIFTSDHGEMLGDFRLFQKHFPYEPAMRVPLVVRGPGIERGVSEALVELVDVAATVADLGDVAFGPHDGRSLRAVLEDPRRAHRDAVTCVEVPYRAVRTATHKYVHNVFDGPECYDLGQDPHERRNIARDDPETSRTLARLLADELGTTEVALPG